MIIGITGGIASSVSRRSIPASQRPIARTIFTRRKGNAVVTLPATTMRLPSTRLRYSCLRGGSFPDVRPGIGSRRNAAGRFHRPKPPHDCVDPNTSLLELKCVRSNAPVTTRVWAESQGTGA